MFVYDLAVPVQQGTVCPDFIRLFSELTLESLQDVESCSKSATPDSSCQFGGRGQEGSDVNLLSSFFSQTSVIAPDVIVVLVVITGAAPRGANGSDLQQPRASGVTSGPNSLGHVTLASKHI